MDQRLDNAPNGYVSFNDKGIIIEVNSTICLMLGYHTDEIKGVKFESLLDIAGRIFFQTHFFPLLKMQQSVHEIFLNLKGKDETLVPVITSARRDESGEEEHNVCVFLPVPNRKKYEEEILAAKKQAQAALEENKELTEAREETKRHSKELDKKVGELKRVNYDLLQFSTIINHEMQECVRKILLFARLEQREKNKDHLDKVIRTAERLKVINSSLNLFIGLDKLHAELQSVNLNGCLQKAISKVLDESQFGGLEVESDILPEVDGFEDDLVLLFYHLLNNSVKFRKGDHVLIRISCSIYRENIYKETSDKYEYHDVVRIAISDNGQGFDSKHKDYVFAFLKQLNHDAMGSGIGLAICKKIMANHGGSISIDATENVGTTVKIVLPFKYRV